MPSLPEQIKKQKTQNNNNIRFVMKK